MSTACSARTLLASPPYLTRVISCPSLCYYCRTNLPKTRYTRGLSDPHAFPFDSLNVSMICGIRPGYLMTDAGMTGAAQIGPPSTHTRPQPRVRSRCQRAASHSCQRLAGSPPTPTPPPVAGWPAAVRTRLSGQHELLAADGTARWRHADQPARSHRL